MDSLEYLDIYNDELYHHGVKGMKWGVRRAERRQQRKDLKAARAKETAEAKSSHKKWVQEAKEMGLSKRQTRQIGTKRYIEAANTNIRYNNKYQEIERNIKNSGKPATAKQKQQLDDIKNKMDKVYDENIKYKRSFNQQYNRIQAANLAMLAVSSTLTGYMFYDALFN